MPDAVLERSATSADGLTVTLYDGDGVETLDGIAGAGAKLGDDALLWIDADSPDDETIRAIADEFDLDDESADWLASPRPSPSFRDGGHFVHVTSYLPDAKNPGELVVVDCVAARGWVVTTHRGGTEIIEHFRQLAAGSGPTGTLDGPGFLATLLEWVLHRYVAAFERLEDELEEFDTRALERQTKVEQELEALVELRRRAGSLRRALTSHRWPLLALTHPELEPVGDDESALRFRVVLERYETTLQAARDARDGIVNSFDVLIAWTGHRTNEIVKLLTLASAIFLPGALLAGVMGMNFKVSLFDHAAVFWVIVAMIVGIGVAIVTVATRRDWV